MSAKVESGGSAQVYYLTFRLSRVDACLDVCVIPRRGYCSNFRSEGPRRLVILGLYCDIKFLNINLGTFLPDLVPGNLRLGLLTK
jgi:hypothetical protein